MQCPACQRTIDAQTSISLAKKWGMPLLDAYMHAKNPSKKDPFDKAKMKLWDRTIGDQSRGILSRCWLCDMPTKSLWG
jgi:hypothetical protein